MCIVPDSFRIVHHKCNGLLPCSNCRDFNAHCEYLAPNPKSASLQKEQQSVRAVEERVAELESILTSSGLRGLVHGNRPSTDSGSNDEIRVGSLDTTPGLPIATPLMNQGVPRRRSLTIEKHSPSEASSKDASNPLDTVAEILRDLSIEASGGYIGASSQITMGRMISAIMQAKMSGSSVGTGDKAEEEEEHLSPKSATTNSLIPNSESSFDLALVSPAIAEKLYVAYIRHIATRWPVMHTPFLRRLHNDRVILCDPFQLAVIHLVYAIGGRFLETTGETGNFFPEQHYEEALKHLDDVCRYNDIRTVQVLLLLSIYSLRSPRGPGAWYYVGWAMRHCIEMGLHRKTRSNRIRCALEHEVRKRVFWTCYCLDRQVSSILGRPFAISDRDIDVELPLDIEEEVEDSAVVLAAASRPGAFTQQAVSKSTSMTGFIYICRLRRIESRIQQSIYRVDEASPVTSGEVERFIQLLEEWRQSMPQDARTSNQQAKNPDSSTPICVDGYDNYMVYYYKCMRFLLHPIILSAEMADTRFLKKCAEACGGVCQTYKKLHQAVPVGFSVMALHSVFLAGLTLLYCTWAAPRDVFSISSSGHMNDCSIVLYIITERWVGARKYRDVFESIKQAVLESIEEGEYEPRRAIRSLQLRTELGAAFQAMGGGSGRGEEAGGQGEFSAMVADMAGGVAASGERDIESGYAQTTIEGPGVEDLDVPSSGFNFTFPLDGVPFDFQHPDSFGNMDISMGNVNMSTPSGHDWM